MSKQIIRDRYTHCHIIAIQLLIVSSICEYYRFAWDYTENENVWSSDRDRYRGLLYKIEHDESRCRGEGVERKSHQYMYNMYSNLTQ